MGTEKKNPYIPLKREHVRTLAKVIADQTEIKEEEAVSMLYHYQYLKLVELDERGVTDYFGMGRLRVDEDHPDGYRLDPYSSKKIDLRKQLSLQRWLAGSFGSMGDVSKLRTEIPVGFGFPVKSYIQKLADHWEISAAKVEGIFREQMGYALVELMEKGEGHLPDFGVITFGEGGVTDLVLDFNEEVEEILKSSSGDDG